MTDFTPRKFDFGTVFDAEGGVYQPVRTKRAFTPEEVEAIRLKAFAEGQTSSVAQSEAAVAKTLQEISVVSRGALTALTELAHSHRTASAELAMACARKIADAALEGAARYRASGAADPNVCAEIEGMVAPAAQPISIAATTAILFFVTRSLLSRRPT